MATKKQQEKKKKAREREVHAKLLRRREAARAERKLAEEEERQRQIVEEFAQGKSQPIISDKSKEAQRDAAKARAVSDQLKKNLEMLEALEREHELEQRRRAELNKELEQEGFKSIKEKMDALHQKALEMTGNAEALAEAQEEYAAQQKEKENVVVEIEEEN